MRIDIRKLLCWLLIGAGLYTLFPFLYLARYNQPAADDFILAVRDRTTDFGPVFKDIYFNWSGRYAASLIARLNPMISGSYYYYKLYPVIIIVSFTIAVILLLREILKGKASRLEILALSAVFIYLVFTQTPSIAEAFYWFSGSCIYQTTNVGTLLLLTTLCRLERANSPFLKWLYFVLAALLCIFIIGCNEVSMFVACFIVFSFAGFKFFVQKKVKTFHLGLLAICLGCTAFSMMAPGNYTRLQELQVYNQSFLFSVVGAISTGLLYLLKWGTSILITALLYLFFSERLFANKKVSPVKKHRLFFLSISCFAVVFFSLQLFIVWVAGGSNLGRTENVVYFFFLLGFFFNLHLFIYLYLPQRLLRDSFYKLVAAITVLVFFIDMFNIENNVSSAYVDLITGKAKQYNYELNERFVSVKACKTDTCYVKPLSVIPKTLFFVDIKSIYDPKGKGFWLNESYSKFMGKAFVVTTGKLPPVEPNMEIIRQSAKQIRKNTSP